MSIVDIEEKIRSISLNELKYATREKISEIIGSNPCFLPRDIRLRIAKLLIERGISYRKVAELICLSLRDISRAVKTYSPPDAKYSMIETEIFRKAIVMIRKKKAKNPNDLVLRLGIDPDTAKKIFNKILDNESLVASNIMDVVDELNASIEYVEEIRKKLEDLRSSLEQLIKRSETDRLLLSDYIKRAEDHIKKLDEISKLRERIDILSKEVSSLESKVGTLSSNIKDTLDLLQSISLHISLTTQTISDLENLRRAIKMIKILTLPKALECKYYDGQRDICTYLNRIEKLEKLMEDPKLKEVKEFLEREYKLSSIRKGIDLSIFPLCALCEVSIEERLNTLGTELNNVIKNYNKRLDIIEKTLIETTKRKQ